MPNWCEGTLKVRGTKENITKFTLEGLYPVDPFGRKRDRLSLNEYGYIESDETCWIENTRRGFVEGVGIFLPNYKEDEQVILTLDSKFAWGINAEELLATCKKYHVDMKIYAFERGMEFNQSIEIVDGKILNDEEINFEDYQWDCICPNMGG